MRYFMLKKMKMEHGVLKNIFDKYLCADRSGNILCNKARKKDFEFFRIIVDEISK